MEIGGIDLTFTCKRGFEAYASIMFAATKVWPNCVSENDEDKDFFIYKDGNSLTKWNRIEQEEDAADMIHVLPRETQITIVIGKMDADNLKICKLITEDILEAFVETPIIEDTYKGHNLDDYYDNLLKGGWKEGS
jgi:dTDP-D-glucose 4,6-dehydratase